MGVDNLKHSEITDKIIKSFYKVYNTLGHGFLEKVYENALYLELLGTGLHIEKQKKIKVYYESKEVGEYYADLIVENKVIVELKAVTEVQPRFYIQIINYLKIFKIEIGLLINFGNTSLQYRRFANSR